MPRIKLISTNKKITLLITMIIIVFGLMTILFPLFLLHLIPQSGMGYFLVEHLYYGYIFIPIMLYFIYTGVYFYKIKIDSYVIDRFSLFIMFFFVYWNFIEL